MSDIGFDPRPYCSRLAKACPERFTEATVTVLTSRSTYENVWHIVDATRPNLPVRLNLDWTLWAFFGPLADERKIEDIRPWDMGTKQSDDRFPTLLEEIIAAVVESFESEVKG